MFLEIVKKIQFEQDQTCIVKLCAIQCIVNFSFGKPNVIDVSDIDPSKAIDTIRDKYNEIYSGLWNDIMDRSILEEDK